MFRLSNSVLDVFNFSGLYRFVLNMGTDPVRTSLAIHGCFKIYSMKSALQDGSVPYDFEHGEAFNFKRVGFAAR